MEAFFQSNIFLVFFGVAFWYVIQWSMAKNKVSKLLKDRLAICDTEVEKALVRKNPKYKFHLSDWFHDNSDEMLISVFSSICLILFDTVAADIINRKFFADDPIELGKAVFLFGGVLGDLAYRAVVKIKGD